MTSPPTSATRRCSTASARRSPWPATRNRRRSSVDDCSRGAVFRRRRVLLRPSRVSGDRRSRLRRKAAPLEQSSTDDLRRFLVAGHGDRLAEAVEHLLVALVVGLVIRRHLKLRRGNGHADDERVTSPRLLAEVVEEVVHLLGCARLAPTTGIVEQLV